MKQSNIFAWDKCEITVDKKNAILNPMWIYTNWQSQKVLCCAPHSPSTSAMIVWEIKATPHQS